MAGIAESPPLGLGQLLEQHRFVVPNHQRDYSWTIDEVKQLLDDIDDAMARNDPFYFIGLMVFMGPDDDGVLTVLDGQQRLATAILFFSAVRNWLNQHSDHRADAQMIQDWFIGRGELMVRTLRPRLIMNTANNDAFNAYVVASVPVAEIKSTLGKLRKADRNRRLLEAAAFCHDRVAEVVSSSMDSAQAAQRLVRIVNYLRETASVARLTVSSDGMAFTIFETLNDRGLELAPLDLIKNFLFGQAEKHPQPRIGDMEQRWAQMMNTLRNVKPAAFLKAFWTSRHGRVQMPNLFTLLKRHYNSPQKAVDLSIEMLAVSEQFVATESPDDPIWSPYPPACRETIKWLKVLGAQQFPPIILAAFHGFDEREMERLLRLLEVLVVRYQLIGGGRTGLLEVASARLAHKIFKGELATATAAFADLQDVYPSDDDFKAAFATKEEQTNPKADYLLRRLEGEERRINGQAETPDDPGAGLTIEHVLPKKPQSDSWQPLIEADRSLVDDCVFKLGNLCLLGKTNRELGKAKKGGAVDDSFATKVGAYATSTVLTTRMITDATTWDRMAIKHRQAHLAKLAANVWRFQ